MDQTPIPRKCTTGRTQFGMEMIQQQTMMHHLFILSQSKHGVNSSSKHRTKSKIYFVKINPHPFINTTGYDIKIGL